MEKPDDDRTGGAAPSLTDRAYARLEELIATLALAPGEALSEADLVQRLSIGRTPVREALQRLAMEGMVTILPRRGVIVSEINLARQLELLELRREVERLIARKSARRAVPAERRAFAGLAAALRRSADDEDDIAFMRLDRELNAALVAACRNEYAAKTMRLIQGLARRFWYQHHQRVGDLRRSAMLHAAVAEAIGRGEPEAAAAASDALMDYIDEFTRATIEPA
jgi:DNA-binding GntR family transcriptional regulator